MPDPEPTLDEQFAAARAHSQALLNQASEMREFKPPGETAGPPQLYSALVAVRGYLDRLEVILVTAVMDRDAATAHARHLEQVADDAWDDEATRRTPGAARRDFEGAQERYAVWRLKTRPQREAARAARDCADVLASAEKSIQAMYRGLDSSRLDLHRRLSALAFMSSIES